MTILHRHVTARVKLKITIPIINISLNDNKLIMKFIMFILFNNSLS